MTFLYSITEKGLDHVAENILGFLDAKSLCATELVCREWHRVISEGMLWRKLIERKVIIITEKSGLCCRPIVPSIKISFFFTIKVRTDTLWSGLAKRRKWIKYLFKPAPGEQHPDHFYYRRLYPTIIKDIDRTESNWRCSQNKHNLQRINCRSESSKGVYCLQYDDQKIVSGLRDNTIKIWNRTNLSMAQVRNHFCL